MKLEQIMELALTRTTNIDRYVAGTIGLMTPPPQPFGCGSDTIPMYTSPLYDHTPLRQTTLFEYGVKPLGPVYEPPRYEPPKIEIEPYTCGMKLDGGYNLFGNKSTAILHDPETGLSIHHHPNGPGAINYNEHRLGILGREFHLPKYKNNNDYL